MKIQIALTPDGGKNLNEAICDIIDTYIDGGFKKLGAKAVFRTSGIFGDSGSNALFSRLIPFFETESKNFFEENHIYADIDDLKLNKKGEKLEVSLALKNIDYKKSITENEDRIIDALKTLAPENIAWQILDILGADKTPAVSAVLDSVPDEKKEAIIRLLIAEFNPKIRAAITDILKDNRVDLVVKKLSFA